MGLRSDDHEPRERRVYGGDCFASACEICDIGCDVVVLGGGLYRIEDDVGVEICASGIDYVAGSDCVQAC